MAESNISWLQEVTESTLTICVNLNLYPLEALFRVCYAFTDKCYLFLSIEDDPAVVSVRFARKQLECDLAAVAGEFSNDLIDQRVRFDIARSTSPIRELIVAQAFAEADLLDRSTSEASYLDDPRGIAK